MEIPTYREKTCERKVAHFRTQLARGPLLTSSERKSLLQEMQAFCDSLSMGNMVLCSAGLGLGAAVLPVIGIVSGPLAGGALGAYLARRLARYRKEVLEMIRVLAG